MAEPVAIVLVGGASTRMGTDKASLVVDGITMLGRVRNAVEAAGIRSVVIVGGDHVPDAPGGGGPLAGIVGGWRYLLAEGVDPDPVVVLSCDLPSLAPAVIEALVEQSVGREHGALAHDGRRKQPLVAAYRPAACQAFETAFEAGVRSPRACFEGWDLAVVAIEQSLVADADTPADLAGFDVQWPS